MDRDSPSQIILHEDKQLSVMFMHSFCQQQNSIALCYAIILSSCVLIIGKNENNWNDTLNEPLFPSLSSSLPSSSSLSSLHEEQEKLMEE